MYKMEELKYPLDGLEPYIDARTIDIHYNKHYKKYLDNLNKFLTEANYDQRYSKEDLVNHIDIFPLNIRDDILYNLGGVLNHELYFKNMSPNKNNVPSGLLKEKIDSQYGNFLNFKKEFKRLALLLMGSGYTFLALDRNKKLLIINTSNQDTPYSYNLIPLMTIDLWEHAYYLKYQELKEEYIDAFFNVVDFKVINEIYEKNI